MQVTCGEPSVLSVTRCASEPDSISSRALCGSFMALIIALSACSCRKTFVRGHMVLDTEARACGADEEAPRKAILQREKVVEHARP